MSHESLTEHLRAAVDRQRLVDTAVRLVGVPSPTGTAGAVADCLAEILCADGFVVERPVAGHAAAPAVVVRLESGRPGKTLEFDGHLDTVHLPFVAPEITNGNITGSGACDMKGGLAAAVEALRVLRDANALTCGSVLLVAHDLHEAPWGLGEQLNDLITSGVHGDAVLIPEPLRDKLPIAGRGAATWQVTFRRNGPPVHEVMRPLDEPSVIAAAARFVTALESLGTELTVKRHAIAGNESVFVGQIHAGEIYNQYPTACFVEGTRRWLPDSDSRAVEAQFRKVVDDVTTATGSSADIAWRPVRGAFALDMNDPLVRAFQVAYGTQNGTPLATGPKPFVDDGNSFWALAGVPAITHGPRAGGQHTVNEWVSIDDLVRVAHLYALTAVLYLRDNASAR